MTTLGLLLLLVGAAGAQAPVEKSSPEPTGLPLLSAPTVPVTVPMAVDRIESFDQSMTSLSADFKQFVKWEDSGSSQQVDGHVDYRKPELLRIEQKTPEPQLIVGDGDWLWVYRKSIDQVIQTKMEDWKKSEPLAQGLLDFGAYAQMLKRYDVEVSSVVPIEGGHSRLELTLRPRQGPPDFTLKLRMTTRDFFPAETELRVGSVSVHSLFSNIRYNPAIPDDRFRFKPPPGAEVFKNFKPPQAQ